MAEYQNWKLTHTRLGPGTFPPAVSHQWSNGVAAKTCSYFRAQTKTTWANNSACERIHSWTTERTKIPKLLNKQTQAHSSHGHSQNKTKNNTKVQPLKAIGRTVQQAVRAGRLGIRAAEKLLGRTGRRVGGRRGGNRKAPMPKTIGNETWSTSEPYIKDSPLC